MSASPKVLLGDSSPSTLAPNVLDVLVQLVICVREVGTLYAETDNLEAQRAQSVENTASVLGDLDKFRQHSEIGLRATAQESTRPEIHQHAEEAIASIGAMVDRWRRSYTATHEREIQRISTRTAEIERDMRSSLERLLFPLRVEAAERRLGRVFDGQQYNNTIEAEFVPGLRLRLELQDGGIEVPQRIRTLLGGKGIKVQVGTKRSGLLRRGEEPNYVTLDDYFLIDAEVNPETARVLLSKKPGTTDALRIELSAQGDGAAGRAVRADGTVEDIPVTDRAVLTELWQVLQAEVARILTQPGRLTGLVLDEEPVDDGAMILQAVERLVDFYRPIVTRIASHSPNPEELAIKIEREGGKREEAYVRKSDLTQHLMALSRDLRYRLGIVELMPEGGEPLAHLEGVGEILTPDAGAHSGRISLDLDLDLEDGPTRASPSQPRPRPPGPGTAAPAGAPRAEVTEDISLRDIVLEESGLLELNADECATRTRVIRSGSSS